MDVQPDSPMGWAALLAILVAIVKVGDGLVGWIGRLMGYKKGLEVEFEKKLVEHRQDVADDLSEIRQYVSATHKMSADHFGVVEGRMAANYKDLLERDDETQREIRAEMKEFVRDHTEQLQRHIDLVAKHLTEKIDLAVGGKRGPRN